MHQVMDNPEHLDTWIAALNGETIDWAKFFDGYTAAVDWPASIFWAEYAEFFPDALILLSTREDAATWHRSMSNTVLKALTMVDRDQHPSGDPDKFLEMTDALWARFVGGADVAPDDAEGSKRAYDNYVQHVRDTAPADRLLEWNASEGWEPLCEALDLPVPDQPFPHSNTTADFRKMLDGGPESGLTTDIFRRER